MSAVAGLVPSRRLLAAVLAGAMLVALTVVLPVVWVAVAAYHAALLAVAVRDAMRLPRRGRIEAARSMPRPLSLGVTQDVRVVVTSAAAAGLEGSVADHAPPPLAAGRREVGGRFDAGGRLEVSYALRPRLRGAYALAAIDVRIRSRGGWWLRQLRLPVADEARVYPDVTAIGRWEGAMRRGLRAYAGRRRARLPGAATAPAGLRDYLPGDEMRRVSWTATARRDSPVVSEVEAERGQQLLIALDCGRLMTAPAGHLTKLDHAVNAALLLAWVAASAGDRVGVMAFSDVVHAFEAPRRGMEQVRRVNQALYRVPAVYAEPEYGDALALAALRLRHRSLVVLLTDVLDAEASADLVAHALRLGARHLVLAVAMGDPEVLGALTRPVRTSEEAYRSAAAEELLQARRRAFETLQRGGVQCLDVEAGALSPALVERYLALKERALL